MCVCVCLPVLMCRWIRRSRHLYDVQVDGDSDDCRRVATASVTVRTQHLMCLCQFFFKFYFLLLLPVIGCEC